jgi:hypothetical protein
MTFNMLCHGVKDMIFGHFNVVDVVAGSKIVLDPSFMCLISFKSLFN